MSVKNIVILNDFATINGGATRVAINNAIWLSQSGFVVHFFCASPIIDKRLLQAENIRVISTHQNDILTNPNRFQASLDGLWNFKSARELRNLLRTLPSDETIVHIHGYMKALSPSVILAAKSCGFATILTLHDYFLTCPNGGFYNYQSKKVCDLHPLSMKCYLCNCDHRKYLHKIWRAIRGAVQKLLITKPGIIDAFISLSHKSENIIRRDYDLQQKCFYLPTPTFVPHTDRIAVENNSQVIGIGRITPEKGFDIAAAAVKDSEIELVIIGDGSEKNDLPVINPQVHLDGWLPWERIVQRFQKARVLVSPSRWYETQGLVITEAAAYGIPSIISDISAATELIIDGESGLIFKNGSVEDLQTQISNAFDDDLIKKLSVNAYNQYWGHEITPADYVQRLLSIYEKTIRLDDKA